MTGLVKVFRGVRCRAARRMGAALLAVGLSLGASSPGFTADAPATPLGAPAIVQRWRQAVHASAVPATATLRRRMATHEEGLDGVLAEWVTSRGDYHRIADRGVDRDEVVLTGARAERRDWNGFLRRLDGDELKRLRTEAFNAETLAFGPSPAMAAATVAPSADGKAYVLTVTPRGGEPVTWTVDAHSFLPVSSEQAEGEGASTGAAYSDWTSPAGGVRQPGRMVVTESDSPAGRNELVSAKIERVAPAAAFPKLRAGPSDVAMPGAVATIPFTMEANHIVLPVAMGGRPPIGFILDTGDAHETLNTPRLAAFGLTGYGESGMAGGGNAAPSAYVRDVTLAFPGGVELRHQHADALDLSGLERLYGVPLGGLLGYDFLSRFVVEIDYTDKLIRLHRPDGWRYRGPGVVVPITFEDGIPYAEAELSLPARPHLAAHMVMDFGAAGTVTLTAPFVKANDLLRLAGAGAEVSRTPGSDKEFFAQANRRGRLDRLTLGGLSQHDLPISLSANTGGAYGTGQFAGTVGETIFSRYRVFLDYPRHRIVFETTARTDQPYPLSRTFGLTVLAQGPDLRLFRVTAVRAGSPAAAAGFKVGDAITALDGRPASAFRLADLQAVLAADGQAHTLTVARGDVLQDFAVVVHLAPLAGG